jgi:hypothetical protein
MNQESFCAYQHLCKNYRKTDVLPCSESCRLRDLANDNNKCEDIYLDMLPLALEQTKIPLTHFTTMIEDSKEFNMGLSKLREYFNKTSI